MRMSVLGVCWLCSRCCEILDKMDKSSRSYVLLARPSKKASHKYVLVNEFCRRKGPSLFMVARSQVQEVKAHIPQVEVGKLFLGRCRRVR